jgi:phosphate transport system ATP-binding protein
MSDSPTATVDLQGLPRDRTSPSQRSAYPVESVFSLDSVSVRYGDQIALSDVSLDIYKNHITALIGPSGSGKSTLLRCLNRMVDITPNASVEGSLYYHGEDLYGPSIDPVQVRRHIGMVFQSPNPFPRSIYDNVAFGPRLLQTKKKQQLDERVEQALRLGFLWDEVKDRLKMSALSLSGGQQQRLCIARALAIEPDVLLMDEPCSALDPISTSRIEDLIFEMRQSYSIVMVTHNLQQAARVSDMTACMALDADSGETEHKTGQVVEYADTQTIFTKPSDPRTEAYVTGRVG